MTRFARPLLVRLISAACLSLGGHALTGCTSVAELAYDVHADQQAQQCLGLPTQAELSACRARIRLAEEQARSLRQAGGGERAATSAARPAADLCFTRAATGERVCPN
jgi:hypothetical protein